MELKKTKIEEINELAKKIAKDKRVKAVYLFGSYANGKTHIHSDIDLCVFSDDEDYLAGYGSEKIDVSMFAMLPIQIRFRVLKEGIPLVVKDKNFVDKLKIKTLREYIDFRPLMVKFYREKLGCTI